MSPPGLATASEKGVEGLADVRQALRGSVELLQAGARHAVHAPVRPAPGFVPGRPHEPIVLQRAERAIEASGVVAHKPERAQALEQVVAVSGLLAE
jgi:hypothetical protein